MSEPTNVDTVDPHAELRRALSSRPRTIPPRWLYDDRGSELFDQITRLPEYYPTEAERTLLATNAATIAASTGARTVVELGSGTSDKTRALLDAFVAHGAIERFAPLDVSEATLVYAAEVLNQRYADLVVEPVVGDFTRHLAKLAAIGDPGTRLVAFLGGTIGNFYLEERKAFLGVLADVLSPGDQVLVGIDLVKPLERLIAAYDDQAGITDAFIRNSLVAINREMGGDIDVGNFEYVPFWDAREERVDMRLRACEPESARLEALDLELQLEAGEELRIEISTKFRIESFLDELADAGFAHHEVFTDGDFALVLTSRV